MPTYDHELMIGSTTDRFLLARDSNGQASYSVANFVPEHQDSLTFAQINWIGGHGQYEVADPQMYFDGQSIDTTQDGRIILGPKISEVTGGTGSAAKQENYTPWSTGGAVSNLGWYAQTFTPTTSHTVQYVKLLWSRVGNPGIATVSIKATDGSSHPTGSDLCYGVTDANTLITGSPFEWREVTLGTGASLGSGTKYALVAKSQGDGSASYVSWRLDGTSAGTGYTTGDAVLTNNSGGTWAIQATQDLAFEEWAAPTPGGELDSAPVSFLWSTTASKWLCATAGKIYYYNSLDWTAGSTTVAGVKGFAEFNGYIFAALGTGSAYVYSTDASTWITGTLTGKNADGFLSAPNAAGTQNVLWKFSLNNAIHSNTSGINGGSDWSSAAYIGDTTNPITNIFLLGDQLMIGRTDNLYNYDANGGVHALMDDLKFNRSSANFKYVCPWHSNVYFSLQRGMGELTSGMNLTSMGPLIDTGDIDKVGDIVGITADRDWLYVAVLESTTTTIYKGRKDENGRWAWCPFVYLGANACSTIAICQHSPTDRRLWFGYGTHTGYVTLTENPTADDTARFAPSGNVRMSYFYGTNPYWDKMFQSIVTETMGCTASIAVQPKYRKDTETSMTNLTSAIITNGVVETDLSADLSGKRIQFELDLTTNDPTKTPQVLMFQARGAEKPEGSRVHDATYIIGDRPTDKVKTLRNLFRTARTSTSLIRFADLRYGDRTSGSAGIDYVNCVLEPGYPQEVEVIQEKGRQPELAIKLRLREVNFT